MKPIFQVTIDDSEGIYEVTIAEGSGAIAFDIVPLRIDGQDVSPDIEIPEGVIDAIVEEFERLTTK